MRLLACIDPGVKYYGLALFEGQTLIAARKEHADCIHSVRANLCVVERPRKANDDRSTRGDIQDLEYAAGGYAAHFSSSKAVQASNVPKDIRHARALAALLPGELAVLPKQKTHLKHVLCAVYIGLKELGRL